MFDYVGGFCVLWCFRVLAGAVFICVLWWWCRLFPVLIGVLCVLCVFVFVLFVLSLAALLRV